VKSFPAFGIMLKSPARREELRTLLQENSGLPGPRANLELAHSFAAAMAALHLEEWQWEFLVEMASTSVSKAPVNSPKEYLAFCGVLALGAQYAGGLPRPRRRVALAALKAAASDRRWRVREASAQGLQLVGEKDAAALRHIIDEWLPQSSLLEKRAIMAALAHPPLLGDPEVARYCLETARTVLASVSRLEEKARKDEAFKILRQGLGYALSVFVASSPAEGFALLRKAAAVRDSDMAWIIRENLKKKRLSDPFPKEVKEVSLILEESNAR
jgi:hypothetical protein